MMTSRICCFTLLAAAWAVPVFASGNPRQQKIRLVGYELDLGASEVLYRFDTFDPADWTITRHTPPWTVTADCVTGGGPDEPKAGQIFYRTPVKGDVVMEFDARLIPPSYHDFVWCWNAEFGGDGTDRWKSGYLASLGGWWDNLSGIERLPDFEPQTVCSGLELEPGVTYHIVSGSSEGRHFIAVDGRLVVWFVDKEANIPDRPGYFGFGVYHSHAEYRNLTVYRPCVRKIPHGYEPATQVLANPVGRKYVVVDLSAGPSAASYPVRETDVAPDLKKDACRTTELWLRRIGAGSFEVEPEPLLKRFGYGCLTAVTPWTWFDGKRRFEPGTCRISKPYYLGVFPVTQKQWELVMGTNPSQFKGEGRPVEKVGYDDIRGAKAGAGWPKSDAVDADSFMGRLRAKTGRVFDLPTGPQWEFACRGGTVTRFNDGTDGPMDDLGRFKFNKADGRGGFAEHTTVGSYKPNSLGLYDMHGSVWETVAEWCDDKTRRAGTDLVGAETGRERGRRGGSWCFGADRCGAPDVGKDPPDGRFNDLGFRAMALPRGATGVFGYFGIEKGTDR